MTRKLLSAFLGCGLLVFSSCEQNFTGLETTNKEIKPNAAELAKNYNYSKVSVKKGFEIEAAFLKMDDPTSSNFGFSSHNVGMKSGDEIAIKSVTDSKAKLGRVLFYDQKLSLNNAISCGSCHHQAKGFADGLAFSPGFEGRTTTRNSMAISNPAMSHSGMFWDRREKSVLDMSLRPITNHIEMGMEDLTILEKKLGAIDYYPQLFSEAYNGSPVVSKAKISECIAAFVRSMISWDSKFDEGRSSNFVNFTTEEKRGMDIFGGPNFAKTLDNTTSGNVDFFNVQDGACNGCHNAPMFNDASNTFGGSAYDDNSFDNSIGGVNIGLDKVSKDVGTGKGAFKIPTLRNVELTFPYMHDGRFKTLEEVVTHYNEKIQPSNNLHRKLKDKNGNPKRLNLTPNDQKALVAFLKTLTDKKFISDPKYSDPFK
jgi:cytochrome c peroxidase